MPALSYKGQFVEYVEAGLQNPPPKGKRIKRQTIRNYRKRPFKKGDILYHYFGQRSKWSRKLGISGNPHFDVGLKSEVNFVRSYETKDKLPHGDKFHWCHPSRFILKTKHLTF